MDLELAGKTVIVTGGTGGIGYGISMEFLREGATVASVSRDPRLTDAMTERAADLGYEGRLMGIAVDVTDRGSVDDMVHQVTELFGAVDVLVNNAGGHGEPAAFAESTPGTHAYEYTFNVGGVVNCMQSVAGDLLARGRGNVVNIASIAARVGPMSRSASHYSAMKGAINTLTRSVAYEWAPHGVRVNSVEPGITAPESRDQLGPGSTWWQLEAAHPGMLDQAIRGEMSELPPHFPEIPLGRLGRPSDVARLVCFLASDAVAGYITGQNIAVDGGVTVR